MTAEEYRKWELEEDGMPISAGMRPYHCGPGEFKPMVVRLDMGDIPGSQRDYVLMAIERILAEAKVNPDPQREIEGRKLTVHERVSQLLLGASQPPDPYDQKGKIQARPQRATA